MKTDERPTTTRRLNRLAIVIAVATIVIGAAVVAILASPHFGGPSSSAQTTQERSSSSSTAASSTASYSSTTTFSSSSSPTVYGNQSFLFVQATVSGNSGTSVVVNATYRGTGDGTAPGTAVLVGVAYPAQTSYIPVTGGPSYGPICCPLVRSYSPGGAVTATTEIQTGAQGASSSPSSSSSLLSFVSLAENSSYLVMLHIAASAAGGSPLSQTLDLYLQTSASGDATGGQAGTGPTLYDPDNGLVYVADPGVDSVTAINGSTGRVAATITLPEMIGGQLHLLYDPDNRRLYVWSPFSPEVFAIDTSTNLVAAKLVLSAPGQSISDLVYDAANGKLFAVNFYSDVLAVDGGTDDVVANITGIQGAYSMTLDPQVDELLVQAYNGTTYAISADTDRIVGTVPVSASTLFSFYDPDDGLLYGHSGSDMVALNATTFEQVGPSPGYLGSFVLYDQYNKDLYFYSGSEANSVGGNLTVFSTSTDSVVAVIPVPGLSEGLVEEQPSFAYDPATGDVYATELTNQHTVGLLVVSGSSNAVVSQTFPTGLPLSDIALDPSDGMLYGGNGDGSSVIFGLDLASGAVTTIQVGTAQVEILPD